MRPIFLDTNDIESFMPLEQVRASAEIFEQMGAHIIERVYPAMDHIVNDDEIAAARSIMHEVGRG